MGCGMSSLDPKHQGFNRCGNGDEGESLHENSNKINKKKKNKDVAKGMKPLGVEETKNKDEHEFSDGDFIGPGSPSFREYCNDYDGGDRSSTEYSNDSDSSGSIKNGSEALLNRNNKPMNDESVDSNKEPLKKERRKRGFKNAISKRKTRGRRNLLNFACYSGNTQAHVQDSSDKNVEKTA